MIPAAHLATVGHGDETRTATIGQDRDSGLAGHLAMPDITMCDSISKNGQCPVRDQCYRYTATPNEFRQAFFTEAPLEADGTCDHFMLVERQAVTEGARHE